MKLTLGNLVLELDLSLEDVGGGPGLGKSYTVLSINVLGLEVTSDGVRLGVTGSSDAESDVVRGTSLRKRGKNRVSYRILTELISRYLFPAITSSASFHRS